jgi:hypothetical protein
MRAGYGLKLMDVDVPEVLNAFNSKQEFYEAYNRYVEDTSQAFGHGIGTMPGFGNKANGRSLNISSMLSEYACL